MAVCVAMHFVRAGALWIKERLPLPSKATTVTISLLHYLATFMPQPLLLIALTPTTTCLVILLPTPQVSRDGGGGGGLAGPFDPTV